VGNWIAACDRILELRPTVVVPGHGPVATPAAVAELRGYFEFLSAEARVRYDQGMSPLDAARDIDLGDYAGWGEKERVVANIHALYGEFGAGPRPDLITVMGDMATLAEHQGKVPPPESPRSGSNLH
jgi:glyoxylase-like metal-dependent hydrolase (beta-lactamase superfamily II)